MINNIIGRPVSPTGVLIGYLLLIASVVLVFLFGFFPSAFLMIVSMVMISLVEGVQVDSSNKKFRSYFSFLGIKKGKWQELDKFPFLSVLRTNKQQNLGLGFAPVAGISLKFVKYEICLLSETHYDRLLLKAVDQKEEALRIVEEYSLKLNKPVVEYHPKQISKRRR